MSLTTVGLDVRDDWIEIRNTELGGLVIRRDEPAIQVCELLSKLVKQSTKGDVSFFLPPVPPSYGRPLTLYSFLWTILVLHLLVIYAYTWVHVPSATSSTCCELQQPRWYCSGVISSLMRPYRQLWAFNAEVTASPEIAPPPCFHGWPTVLVLFAWDAWGGCL